MKTKYITCESSKVSGLVRFYIPQGSNNGLLPSSQYLSWSRLRGLRTADHPWVLLRGFGGRGCVVCFTCCVLSAALRS